MDNYDEHVCGSVGLSIREDISIEPRVQSSPNFLCMLSVALSLLFVQGITTYGLAGCATVRATSAL